MKPLPPRASQPEAQPTLARLRERVQGAMNRLGTWGKQVLWSSQEEERGEARTFAAGAGESRGREPEEASSARATGSVRPVTPARLGQPVRGQRSYLTEMLGDPSPRRAEGGGMDMAATPADHSGAEASRQRDAAPGEQDAAPEQPGAESALPPEPTPEQAEETRLALTRKLLRGSRNGMLLTLEPGYVWVQVIEVLAARLAESPTFFQGSVLSLDTRRRGLEQREIDELQALLAPYGMTFKEVGSDELKDMRTLPSGAPRPVPIGETTPTLAIRANDTTNALFTQRTIRSGQRLRYESSVVIMGDVNPGAEVIAGGDVVVWGALRGIVHAGYPRKEDAVVCALVLAPVQLRIGAFASRPPEDGAAPQPIPEVASVKNGQIVVESWNAGRASRR